MENLSTTEIDVLIEALDSWEDKDEKMNLAKIFLFPILTRSLGEMPEELKIKEAEEEKKQESEKKIRKETSVLIKAKLIGIKQSMSINKAMKQNNK